MNPPGESKHIVAIIGGAVAGSEAAALAVKRGAFAVVFEQNARPYGKIEDGLPRWHAKLRDREYSRIDANLDSPDVFYVPDTAIGPDVPFSELREQVGFEAIVLATGAWRDRPLPVGGADAYVGKGLVYQNALVHWFNRSGEANYEGPTYDVRDPVIVVGGGLGSIDVVKIINLELYCQALRARGIEVDLIEMEHRGIPETLAKHGITAEELGVSGATLYYRRSRYEMPLTPAVAKDDAQREKLRAARARIIERVMKKYLVSLEEYCSPVGTIDEDGRLGGLVFRRMEQAGAKLVEVPGSDFEVRAPLTVSSIGSLPVLIPGIPASGDLYSFANEECGELAGIHRVFALGNVLTGKGNIRDSRVSASVVADRIIDNLLGVPEHHADADALSDALHGELSKRAEALVDGALADATPLSSEQQASVLTWVRGRQVAVGYSGYQDWMAKTRAAARG